MSITTDERYFDSIVRSGTLSSAGKELNMSQPALTKALKRLRDKYGDELLEFDRGRVKLTSAGNVLHDHIQRGMLEEERLRDRLRAVRKPGYGSIHVGFGSYIGEAVAAESFVKWQESFPSYRARLLISGFDYLRNLLDSERLDFYLADFEAGRALGNDYAITALRGQQVRYFVRKGHPLLEKKSVSLEDLNQYGGCRTPMTPGYKRAWRKALEKQTTGDTYAPLERILECTDASIMKTIVATSDSVSAMPLHALDLDGRDSGVELLNMEFEGPPAVFAIIRNKYRDVSKAAQRYMDILVEMLGD